MNATREGVQGVQTGAPGGMNATLSKLNIVDGDALMEREFEPLKMPVANLIVEGLTLLCGSSKIGKSWLVLSLCCAVAAGKPFLGRNTEQGSVLYLALEDSHRRLQERLQKLNESPTKYLQFATEAASLDAGLIPSLEKWIRETESPRMIVIDTLQKVRGVAPGRVNAYSTDYEQMGQLKRFADQNHVAVVLVHHLNKMKDVIDPYDRISGSTGLMGSADSTIMLVRERGSDDATMSFVGRDIWGDDVPLHMCNGQWKAVGIEVRQRELYEADPVVKTCRYLVERAFGQGDKTVGITSEAFISTGYEHAKSFIASGSNDLKKKLQRLAEQLWEYDRIIIEFDKRIGSKRGFRIIKEVAQGA